MSATQFSLKCKTIFSIVLSILFVFNISMAHSLYDGGGEKDVKKNSNKIKKIVLDAGHGGKDSGANGKISKEKDVVLSLVLKMGKEIERRYPDVEVIYTRKTDKFIELHERARIANEANADLFISVHCNAAGNRAAKGTETFVLGLHRNDDNLAVAKRENGAILFEENYEENYDGFDPTSEISHIILNMYQNAFLDRSLAFANSLESNLRDRNNRNSRGVKQAGFLVLRNTFMTSILFEAGFLTNPDEEKYLNSEAGQKQIVESFILALNDYKTKLEENPQLAKVKTEKQNHPNQVPVVQAVNVRPQETSTAPESKVIKTVAELEREEAEAQSATQAKEKQDAIPLANPDKEGTIEFCIQLSASPNKSNLSAAEWRNIENLSVRYENKMYKYQITGIHNYSEANNLKNKMIQRGFTGAFVVAYNNGDRIDVSEAISLSK